jgi:hypothetical protein
VVEQCCSGQGLRTDKDKDEPSPVLYGKIKRENGVTAVAPPFIAAREWIGACRLSSDKVG